MCFLIFFNKDLRSMCYQQGIMFKKYPSFWLCAFGFFGGIFVAEDFAGGFGWARWLSVACVFAIFLARKLRLKFIWLLVGFLLGVFRFAVALPGFSDTSFVSHYNGMEDFSFQGQVVREVDRRSDCQNLTIEVDEPLHGFVYVKVWRYPEYEYGDVLQVYGDLQEPASFEDFSYKNYLSRYGVYSVMYHPSVELVEGGGGNFFWRELFKFKGYFEGVLNRIFPEPASSLAAGLLLGSRRGIPEEIQNYFRITGLSHIVAISGYNITIVIAFVGALLQFLPKRKQIIAASVFVMLFTVFVGASAAVVRASIMGVIGLAAVWFGRKTFVTNSLIAAAFLMNLINPKILVYDVGFQLSFAATCGLVYVSPLLHEWVELKFPRFYGAIPEGFCIRDSLFLTCSAQITALPIILMNFEQLSLVSPFANMFVAVLIPWAMLLSFGAVLVYVVGLKFFGLLVGYYAWFFLEAIVAIAEKCSAIPFASVQMGFVEPWMVGVYFVVLARVIGDHAIFSMNKFS